MRCAAVANALPLYVGHDLDSGKSHEIAAHLAKCDRCRALEAGLRDSRAWLESAPPPPFDESDFSEVRRGVWRAIEEGALGARNDRPPEGRLVLAGGLLAAVVLAVFLLLRPRPEARPPAAKGPSVSPVAVAAVEPAPRPAPREEEARAPARDPAVQSSSPARVRSATAAAEPSVVRIEFQTANPGVRIIWLVKKGDGMPSVAAGRNQEVS